MINSMSEKKIIYTAEFGKDFMSWHEWVYRTRSPEEIAEYETEDEAPGRMTSGKEALFRAWIKDQRILAHTVYVDDDDNFMEHFQFTIFPQEET
jgi:hypothetical protein